MFDYYIDHDTKQFTPWTEKIPKFELDSDIPLQVTLRTICVQSIKGLFWHLL